MPDAQNIKSPFLFVMTESYGRSAELRLGSSRGLDRTIEFMKLIEVNSSKSPSKFAESDAGFEE